MRFLCILYMTLFFVCTVLAEDVLLWHDPAAAYRIVFEQEKSIHPCVIDDRMLCLPGRFSKGVRVYDEDGNLLPARLYETGGVLVPPVLRREVRILYFGYSQQQPNGNYEPPDKNNRLCLFSAGNWGVSDSPEEWKKANLERVHKQMEQAAKNVKHEICDPKHCQKIRNSYRRCRMCFLPFCARNPIVTQGKAASRLWAQDPLRSLMTTCCRGLLMHPDYEFMPTDHYSCIAGAEKRSLMRYYTGLEKLRKEEQTIMEDPEEGFQKQLLNHWKEQRKGNPEFGQIFVTRRPFDTGDRSLLYYTGSLYAAETGTYQFLVNANSTRILRIDDTIVFRQFGVAANKSALSSGSIELTKGLHTFMLCYQKKNIGTWLAAAWKPPYATQFRLLSEEDFLPGLPAGILKIESQTGLNYPLVRRDDKFQLFTDKLTRAGVHSFYALDGSTLSFRFKDATYAAFENTFFLPGEKNVVELINAKDSRKDFAEIGGAESEVVVMSDGKAPLHIAEYPRPKTRATVPPELRFRLFVPLFVYEGENLEGTLEIQSRLPFPFVGEFSTKTEAYEQVEKLHFPAHQQEGTDRFSQDLLYKKNFPVGAEMMNFRIGVNGFPVDETAFSCLPVEDLVPFEWRDGAFYRSDNQAQLAIRLRHPDIEELRKWELMRTLKESRRKTQKLLILCDDFGTFRETVTQAFAAGKISCEFLTWTPENESDGSPVPETLFEAYEKIRTTDADSVLIIPPVQSRRKTHSMRDELRCMAFLVETTRQNPKIRHIALSSCVPSARFDAKPEEDRTFASQLRALKREYGLSFCELNAALRRVEPETASELYPANYSFPAARYLVSLYEGAQ